jgi:hypothetical protein
MRRKNLPVFTIVGDVTLLPGYEAAREAKRAEEQKIWNDAATSILGEMPNSDLYETRYVEMNSEEIYDQLLMPTADWRDALRDHVQQSTGWVRPVTMAPGSYPEDGSHVLSEEFLQDFMNEVKGIMNHTNCQFHVFTVGENGELIEQDGNNG